MDKRFACKSISQNQRESTGEKATTKSGYQGVK